MKFKVNPEVGKAMEEKDWKESGKLGGEREDGGQAE